MLPLSQPPPPRERIIAAFRRAESHELTAAKYLSEVRGILARAEASGASLFAWAAYSFSLAWEGESLEEAIEFCVNLSRGKDYACGMAQGVLEQLYGTPPARADLGWGDALLFATELSRSAQPGEIHVRMDSADPRLRLTRATVDSAVEKFTGPVGLLAIDKPLRQEGSQSAEPREMSPATFDRAAPNPQAVAAHISQASLDAVSGGDAQALERWSEGMKSSDDTDPLSQRMDAMSRLTRGRVSDALSSLVAARKNAEGQSGGARCQASLALAVGLSFAGRHHESLLEALDALARARQAEDEKAIRACIVFLSTLYKKVGRPQEASLIACARS